jgi:hypothetical protein
MTLKTDRRTQLRKRPLSLVYIELPPSNGGMMRDLSEHGFSLRAMIPLRQSEKVPFSFALDAGARIDGEAIVVRVDDGGHVAAMEFAGLPPHCRDQIRGWLERFDEPISPEPAPSREEGSKHASLTELRTKMRVRKPPSSAPPAGETATPPQPQNIPVTLPSESSPGLPSPREESAPQPESELPAAMDPLKEEDTAPPPISAPRPASEPPPVSVSPIVEKASPTPANAAEPPIPDDVPPPAAENPHSEPPPALTVLPKPIPASVQEAQPPPTIRRKFEEMETPTLPPLLKLSSVRPGPPPAEITDAPSVPVEMPKSAVEPPAKIFEVPPKMETPAAQREPPPGPASAPAILPRHAPPPALEPLSSLEGETDSDNPGWMDRFTLGRAIGIMLLLALAAGSYVYHREVGQAIIWLGHQIEGDDSPQSSKIPRPQSPAAPHVNPEPAPAASVVVPPSPEVQTSTASIEPRSANLPSPSDKLPTPQTKGAAPGSLVPLTQTSRPLATPPSADSSGESGQAEYLRAMQILRSPGRASEVPAAIQLLWAAVEKGNANAEIDLAELFRTGRGVAKNCDQTRILLSAAARKGSAEARKRLEALGREGCGN